MTTQLSRSARLFLLVSGHFDAARFNADHPNGAGPSRVEIAYAIVVGWLAEPPIVGERNALTIEITENELPVTGAEGTLDVEVLAAGPGG